MTPGDVISVVGILLSVLFAVIGLRWAARLQMPHFELVGDWVPSLDGVPGPSILVRAVRGCDRLTIHGRITGADDESVIWEGPMASHPTSIRELDQITVTVPENMVAHADQARRIWLVFRCRRFGLSFRQTIPAGQLYSRPTPPTPLTPP